jgi:hypothetical protein
MLDEIKNIKLKELGTLSQSEIEEYTKILKLLRPKAQLGFRKAKNLFEMTFAEVELMRRNVANPNGIHKAVALLFDCPEKLITDYRLVQFYHALNHLISQLEHLQNLEKINLRSPVKPEMKNAGVDKLDKFGALNTLDALAKEYSTNPMEVEQWKYGLIYSLMWKRKTEAEIDNNLREANKRK